MFEDAIFLGTFSKLVDGRWFVPCGSYGYSNGVCMLFVPLPLFFYMHRLLDAGPLVLIVTGLIAIFTVGLADEESKDSNPNRLSAYSVFNRGFQRMLGTVDTDSLLAQHIGGGLGANFHMPQNPPNDDDGENLILPPPRHGPPRPPAEAAVAMDPNLQDQHQNEQDNRQPNGNNPIRNNTGGVARKSGKKKRRNLDERRETRRQREMAMAFGYHDDQEGEDVVAMQRLIEEQIAAGRMH